MGPYILILKCLSTDGLNTWHKNAMHKNVNHLSFRCTMYLWVATAIRSLEVRKKIWIKSYSPSDFFFSCWTEVIEHLIWSKSVKENSSQSHEQILWRIKCTMLSSPNLISLNPEKCTWCLIWPEFSFMKIQWLRLYETWGMEMKAILGTDTNICLTCFNCTLKHFYDFVKKEIRSNGSNLGSKWSAV